MSRLDRKVIPPAAVPLQFADALAGIDDLGVSLGRAFAQHGVYALDWLIENRKLPLHIVTRNALGELSTEIVFGLDLVRRGVSAGWTPIISQAGFPLPAFDDLATWEPADWEKCGVWFAALDCVDEETGYPLTLAQEIHA